MSQFIPESCYDYVQVYDSSIRASFAELYILDNTKAADDLVGRVMKFVSNNFHYK